MYSSLFSLVDKVDLRKIFFGIFLFVSLALWILLLSFIGFECPIHQYLHLWCAGCGGTRMFISILHGNFYQAFRYNPLVFILFICGIIYLFFASFIYIKKKEVIVPSTKLLIYILIVFVIYFIVRNIDIFSFLIPTEV